MSNQCLANGKNMPAPTCSFDFKVLRKMYFAYQKNDAGTAMNISAVTKAVINAAIAETEADQDRLYPLEVRWDNQEDAKAENTVETLASGSNIFIREGVRSFTAEAPNITPEMVDKINSWRGLQMAIYMVDSVGNWGYNTDADTKEEIRPVPIDSATLSAVFIPATNDGSPKIKISFDFAQDQDDSLFRYVGKDSLDFEALLDIDTPAVKNITASTVSGISVTEFTIQLKTDYDVDLTGLVTGDFVLYNNTDAAAVTVTTFTDNGEGSYTCEFAAQTSADELGLTITKSGYDFGAINPKIIDIP